MYIWPILQAWSSYDEASQILEREPCPATHPRAHPRGSEVSLALSFSQAVHRVLFPLRHRRCSSFILHQLLSFFYLWCSSAVRSIWQLYVMGKKKKTKNWLPCIENALFYLILKSFERKEKFFLVKRQQWTSLETSLCVQLMTFWLSCVFLLCFPQFNMGNWESTAASTKGKTVAHWRGMSPPAPGSWYFRASKNTLAQKTHSVAFLQTLNGQW